MHPYCIKDSVIFSWLISIQDELMYHLSHSSNSVRNLVYNLLLRHLKQRPDQWRHVLPGINHLQVWKFIKNYKNSCIGYLNALQSGDESVINSGLNNLPEFAVLCQVIIFRWSPKFNRKYFYLGKPAKKPGYFMTTS